MMRLRSVCPLILVLALLAIGFCAECQAADRVFIRVTVKDTQPARLPVQVSMIVFKSSHEVVDKIGFGSKGEVVKYATGFSEEIDWQTLSGVPAIEPGGSSRWVEITDIIYKKFPYEGGWVPYVDRYGQKTFVFGFYSPAHEGKRPIDIGNIESVTASVDFATAPREDAIVKTVTYASGNSCLPIFISKPSERLADYGDQIRSLYDYAVERYELLQDSGLEEQPLAKRIMTSARFQNGYFYPVYDQKTMAAEARIAKLMGIRSITWKIRNVSGVDKTTFPEHRPIYWEDAQPDWVDSNPFADDMSQQVAAKLGPITSQSIEHWKLSADDKVLFKMGDEWRLLTTEAIIKHPGGLEAFRGWLKERGTTPEQIGVSSLDDAAPIKRPEAGSEELARLYWLSAMFQQEVTIDWWKRFVDEMRDQFGGRLIATTEVFQGPFDLTPNVFLLSRSGAFDIDAHEYAQSLWSPSHAAILKAAMYRSAAKFGKSKPGILWCSHRGEDAGSAQIMELDGTTALINGMQHIYLYYYGPQWSAWGSMDDGTIDVFANAAKTLRRAAKLEDYILDGDSPIKSPPAAMLLSQSSELWAGGAENHSDGQGTFLERQILAASLAWNQIPYDVVCEFDIVDHLKNYRVLYVTDPCLSSEAQHAIAAWVRDGGVLFSIAGAAERNEVDRPESLMAKLMPSDGKLASDTSVKVANYKEVKGLYDAPVLGNADWLAGAGKFRMQVIARKESYDIPGGKALAKHDDGSTGAVSFDYGKGKVIRVGTALGTVLARTMSPKFESRVATNQRSYDENICNIYALPFELDPSLVRPIRISKIGVDAMFYENAGSAVVLLADYESAKNDLVDVDIKFAGSYTSCRSEAGVEYPIIHKDGRTIIRGLELGTSEVLIFKKSEILD
jgi:hypothetical protein